MKKQILSRAQQPERKSAKTFYRLLLVMLFALIGVGVLWAANLFETDRDGDGWRDAEEIVAGTSAHEIYWTRAAPATSLRQETLFWVSCTGSKGRTAEADIVDGIWGKFSTGNAPANLCRNVGNRAKIP